MAPVPVPALNGHGGSGAARTWWLWLPVAAYMAGIFVVSSLSKPPAPEGVSDKWLHAWTYAGLALVTVRATSGGGWSGVTVAALAASWLIASGYGLTDEWHQTMTPGRSADLADAAADAMGALAATLGAWAWSIIRRL